MAKSDKKNNTESVIPALLAFQAPDGMKEQESERVEFEFWDPSVGDTLEGTFVAIQQIPQEGGLRPCFVVDTGNIKRDAAGIIMDSGNRGVTGADATDKFKRIRVGQHVFIQFLGHEKVPGKPSPKKVYGVAASSGR